MKRQRVILGLCAMAAVGAAILGTSVSGAAQTAVEAPSRGSITVERAELQRMIEAEVQKQLPPLVEREVHRRMGELLKRIEETQVRLVREQQAGRRWENTRAMLQTLRSQLELYKIMHGDRAPTMEQMKGWRVLTSATDSQGNIVGGGKCGPYLQEAPVSPLTERSGIVAAGAVTAEAGWVYDEKNGVIGVVVPAAEAGAVKGLSRGEYEVGR